MPGGPAQTAAAALEQGSLQSVARRAPPARACQPPPLLIDSATCSADTRCSALAGLVPGCRPSARAGRRSGEALRGILSRVPGPHSQTETVRSGLPSWKVSGFNWFHHFPPLRPHPLAWLPASHCTSARHPPTAQFHCSTLKIFSLGLQGTTPNSGLKQNQFVKQGCPKLSHPQGETVASPYFTEHELNFGRR